MERLLPDTTLLLVVDVQERLAAAMPPESLDRLVRNTSMLLETARVLGMHALASEQYPKGLGPTVPLLREKLEGLGVAPAAKNTFDACAELTIARRLAELAPKAVVVTGMETHVCVFQTVRELVKRGLTTYVVADAVASRTEDNRALGLSLCERAGAIVAPAETIAFDLLGQAGTDAFRAVSKLVR